MQAAIDRVFRTLSFKPADDFAEKPQTDAARREAEALAERFLANFKGQVVYNEHQRH